MSEAGQRGARIAGVDAARGAALVGMAIYHLSWDCAYFGLVAPGFPETPPMRLFSNVVAASFLLLVGVSLALAHQNGLRRRPFVRRLFVVCGAAALVSAATWLIFPGDAIFFGILHCIAAASALAAPMIEAPVALAAGAGLVAFVAPHVFSSPVFNIPALVWLGFGTIPPATVDWRPLLPWSGFVFLGLALGRIALPRLKRSSLAQWRPASGPARALPWAGRHSLVIYLVHQPILFALLFAATGFGAHDATRAATAFRGVCERQCQVHGGEPALCGRRCGCAADGVLQAGLAKAVGADRLDDAQRKRFSVIVQQCARAP